MFAYPSLYEGFGLPVLEAMACGAPVVASCTTAVGETAGDASLLVDPQDVDAIAATLSRVLADEALSTELGRRGLQQTAGYNSGRMAAGLISSWRKALAG